MDDPNWKDIRTKREKKHFECKDCGIDTIHGDNFYMVQFDLWKKYGVGEDMLCMDCFEKRLGRPLTEKDFIDCPVNDWNERVTKLRNQYYE